MPDLAAILNEYAAHDRAWVQANPWRRDCQRRGNCANDWPASVFAWCPPCRLGALEELERREVDAPIVREMVRRNGTNIQKRAAR